MVTASGHEEGHEPPSLRESRQCFILDRRERIGTRGALQPYSYMHFSMDGDWLVTVDKLKYRYIHSNSNINIISKDMDIAKDVGLS